VSEVLRKLEGLRVHLVGLTSLEIADVAVWLSEQGATNLVAHDLCQPDKLPEHFRAAHIGMPKEARAIHFDALMSAELELRLGDDYLKDIESADVVVVSQAWRLYKANQPLHALAASGVQFLTPMEFYLEVAEERGINTIGVTGSNGKSTTSNMILSVLRHAGRTALLAGNYRYRGPILGDLVGAASDTLLVLEVSNHHLMALQSPVDVAVVTNVTENHLEEHDGFDAYVAVKRRLVELQRSGGTAILNADDPVTSTFGPSARGPVRFFTSSGDEAHAYSKQGAIFLNGDRLLGCDELKVPGTHNVQNAMATALVCDAVDMPAKEIAAGLRNFSGITGRLEFVRTVADISFYYDVESTTPESTTKGVEAFGDQPVHLIAGGDNKGLSYEQLASAIQRVGATLYLLPGTASADLAEKAGAIGIQIQNVDSVAQAVSTAFRAAEPHSVVLLSPGARGFYNLYLRGQPSFARLVKKLRASDRTGA